MLDLAYKCEEEIKQLMMETWYNPNYMFFHSAPYRDIFQLPKTDGDWNYRGFVSLDNNHQIIGYISYTINRTHDLVSNIAIINFSDLQKDKITFGRDVVKVVDDIFCKFNLRKIEFYVLIGNPIEKTYDRLVKRYGGNITGIKHKSIKLLDGNYYDQKEYEIFREDYIAATEHIREKLNKINGGTKNGF